MPVPQFVPQMLSTAGAEPSSSCKLGTTSRSSCAWQGLNQWSQFLLPPKVGISMKLEAGMQSEFKPRCSAMESGTWTVMHGHFNHWVKHITFHIVERKGLVHLPTLVRCRSWCPWNVAVKQTCITNSRLLTGWPSVLSVLLPLPSPTHKPHLLQSTNVSFSKWSRTLLPESFLTPWLHTWALLC